VPRVTVAIPTYNRDRWIAGSIESVLGQTHEDLHLVVSDNASTDSTADVVRSFDDPRLEYRRMPENVGLLENHNRIFRGIDTEYFLILPDDDRLKPDALERMIPVLDEHPRAAMVHTAFDVLSPSGEIVLERGNWTNGLTEDKVETGAEFIRESMLYSCRVCASSALTRTAALPPSLFEPEEFPAIDFGMWLRMALDWEMAFIGDSLAAYSIHDSTHSSATGVGTPMRDGYIQGFDLIDKLLEIKLRFLARFGDRVGNASELRSIAHRGHRRELLIAARNATLPARALRPTVRALNDVVRHEPRMLGEVGAWRLLAASLLGGRRVDRIKAYRSERAQQGAPDGSRPAQVHHAD
jgi:glycosyltransferase involved in cell wall biosynthesis